MSNKFTISYKSKQGTELSKWLTQNSNSLKNPLKKIQKVLLINKVYAMEN